jgi:hypothetical protein
VVEAPLSGWVGTYVTRWLGDVHEWGFTLLQAVVALHIVAALGYAVHLPYLGDVDHRYGVWLALLFSVVGLLLTFSVFRQDTR